MKCVQIAHDYCGLYGVICASLLSPLAMAEWIEIIAGRQLTQPHESPLAMAEWIEIVATFFVYDVTSVSASDGRVD